MNIDIVSSTNPDDRNKLVNYGEPDPEAVYKAAMKIEPGASADLRFIKDIIEQIDDLYWEIFSLEFGEEQIPASFWECSDYISNLSPHELHIEYENGLNIVRKEYYALSVSPADGQN